MNHLNFSNPKPYPDSPSPNSERGLGGEVDLSRIHLTRSRLKTNKRFLFALLVALAFAGTWHPAKADGLLFSNGVFRQPLTSHITVAIKDKIATTQLEQTFQNSLDKQVSAV